MDHKIFHPKMNTLPLCSHRIWKLCSYTFLFTVNIYEDMGWACGQHGGKKEYIKNFGGEPFWEIFTWKTKMVVAEYNLKMDLRK
jgi:hypothetical protein